MTFLKDENGQGMVEYALIIGLIAIVAVVALVALGPRIGKLFNKANDKVGSVGN
jgi:pilus assembly protein Flp/PilA